MRRVGWILVVGLLGLALAVAWLALALKLPYRSFPREGVFVDVPRGASARTIARRLAGQGVVRSSLAFETLCRWRARRPLQAGEYFFDHSMNSLEVFQILAEGRVFENEITVPEGFTMFEIAELLEREGITSRAAFLAAARDPAPIVDLATGARSLEGFLFPATYRFPHHVAPLEVVEAMTRRFRDAWQELPETSRTGNALPVDAVVTLASLVERETSAPDERSLVAGVFVNRLRRGLALQCDPTVIYALELAGKYGGSLDSGDLNFPSPYNTYRHSGLPPGPIANPGEAALRAALDPSPAEYLYFVSNTQGGHFFSKTLREHNRNVARYRRLLAESRQVPADKPAEGAPDPSSAKTQAKRPR